MYSSYKGWDSFSCFFSAEYSQLFLKKSYKLLHTNEIETKSYQNCYPFIYFLEHGKLYYQQAVNSPINIQPVLLFYGFVHLIKACLLTIDPSYPSSTSVLAHGVSTRKRKKQQYLFFKDEIKIQKNGLFACMSKNMFQLPSIEGEKFKMGELLQQIPELSDLFHIFTGSPSFLPVSFSNTEAIIPSKILDSYFMSKDRFQHYLESQLGNPVKNVKTSKTSIEVAFSEPLQPVPPFYYNVLDNKHYIPIEKRSVHLPEILVHYLLLYNLSMIARYEIEWWSELLKTMPNQDYPYIESFLSIAAKKGPQLIYNFLAKKM